RCYRQSQVDGSHSQPSRTARKSEPAPLLPALRKGSRSWSPPAPVESGRVGTWTTEGVLEDLVQHCLFLHLSLDLLRLGDRHCVGLDRHGLSEHHQLLRRVRLQGFLEFYRLLGSLKPA